MKDHSCQRLLSIMIVLLLLACVATIVVIITPSSSDDGTNEHLRPPSRRQLKQLDPKTLQWKTLDKTYDQQHSSENYCNGRFLITSHGGVGSTDFMIEVEKAVHQRTRRPGANKIITNIRNDADNFKHKAATLWKHNSSGVTRRSREGQYVCFGKVLVIVGNPFRTIESTVPKFGGEHINKLKEGSGFGYDSRNLTLESLYKQISNTGKDTTGITHYITSWYDASQNPSEWPEVKVVTSKMLYSSAKYYATWLGFNEEQGDNLDVFSAMNYNVSKHHEVMVNVSEEVVNNVLKVFESANQLIAKVEDNAASSF